MRYNKRFIPRRQPLFLEKQGCIPCGKESVASLFLPSQYLNALFEIMKPVKRKELLFSILLSEKKVVSELQSSRSFTPQREQIIRTHDFELPDFR